MKQTDRDTGLSAASGNAAAPRRDWVAERRRAGDEGVLKAVCLALPLPPSFHDALRVPRAEHCLVAEIHGEASSGLDVGQWVATLEALGASAFAVSIAEGSEEAGYETVRAAAQATCLPILCRDRVVDPFQVTMARAHGAAAISLNPGILSEREFRALYWQAVDMGMDVVLEATSAHDLEMGLRIRRNGGDSASGVRIFGVLEDPELKDPLANHVRLAPSVPEDGLGLALRSVRSCEELERLFGLGYDACFVDDVLLDSEDLAACMRKLAGEPHVLPSTGLLPDPPSAPHSR